MATKIFELGMARFGGDAEYVAEYLDFLIQLNDDQSKEGLSLSNYHCHAFV